MSSASVDDVPRARSADRARFAPANWLPPVRLCAWVTAAVVLAPIVLGTLVTTFRVGMADPVWPTTPWYLFVIGWEESPGWLIEHTHRIAAYAAGLFAMLMAVRAWLTKPTAAGAAVGVAAVLATVAGMA